MTWELPAETYLSDGGFPHRCPDATSAQGLVGVQQPGWSGRCAIMNYVVALVRSVTNCAAVR